MPLPNQTREEVLTFLRWWSFTNDYAPTIRDIAEGVGLKSPASVHAHLVRLEEQGLVERLPGRRGWRPTKVVEE